MSSVILVGFSKFTFCVPFFMSQRFNKTYWYDSLGLRLFIFLSTVHFYNSQVHFQLNFVEKKSVVFTF